ncbi:hypothetical protein [Gluconobacter sp. DsW_058]|uniref:hypothetical protein n=1 Tax=Gluconobacter sp. DsW_058 TaxID=1511210 RepID=UPI000A3967DC|nr:hypothetical protein [Gluconobacter sp. DsW_058]OUJ04985.1 hypothetical protein HK24_13460 [Gluconobacter sp. DsW_058]
MRRLLLVVPLLFAAHAFAQTQAANPVEPFSYGVRVGTAKNPLIAALSSVVPSAQAGSTQAAMPVEMFSYGRRVGTQSNPIYVNLGNALDGYLPLTGGNTTGALNGYSYFPGLVGSSASGSTVTLTTDNSGNLTTANCMVIPGQGATEYDINIIGVSSNGADAFLQRFSGVMSYLTTSGYVLTASSSSNNYPAIGSDHGTVAATVAADTNGCLRLTATGGGSGSWKWRAGVHYENLVP